MNLTNKKYNWYEYDNDSNRTIELILDVENKQIIESDDFFNQSEHNIIKARSVLELSYRSGISKFKCAICEQDVKIIGRRIFDRHKTIYFFSHLPNSYDCPIKTDNKLSLSEILSKKYRGINEGPLHKRLKCFIVDRLKDSTSQKKGFNNVETEKTFKGGEVTEKQWRRPDVFARFNNNQLVLELQLSTTFLSVVVARDIFYNLNETYILWVFGSFNIEDQKLMEKDLYYAHKRNVFVLDNNAQNLSREKKELVLNCYWQLPKIVNNHVEIEWHHKMVTIDELTFDEDNFEVYYYNSDKDFYKLFNKEEQRILDEWENAKKVRWNLIYTNIEKRKNLQTEYEVIDKLVEGVARVKKKGKWGYVDKNMTVIIPTIYKEIRDFHNGFVSANLNDKWGIININNETIIPFDFEYIEPYSSGVAKAYKNKNYCFIDEKASIIVPELIPYKEGFKWGFKSLEGDVLIPAIYSNVKPFINGKAWVQISNWGQIDTFGKKVFPFKYGELEEFINGKAKVKHKDSQCYGYVDINGKVVIPFDFVSIDEYINGVAKATKKVLKYFWRRRNRNVYEYKTGFIDDKGEIIIPFIYDELDNLIDGRIKAKRDNCFGYIDEFGNEVISIEYDEIGKFIDGKAKVLKRQQILSWGSDNMVSGYIDEEGKVLIENAEEISENVLKGTKFNKWGLEHEDGSIIIPFDYDIIEPFIDGRAKVQRDGKWGYFDIQGNVLIDCEYSIINDFIDGRAKVQRDGKWGYIDENGRVLLNNAVEIYKDVFFGDIWGKFGIGHINGNIILPFEYDEIGEFLGGKAIAKNNNKYGLVDIYGNVLIPFIYDDLSRLSDEILKCRKEAYWGCVDIHGNIIPYEYEGIIGTYDGGILGIKKHKFVRIPFNINAEKLNLKVSSITNFGVFLNIYSHFDGLLHVSSIRKAGKELSNIVQGDRLDVYINNIDDATQRISFTLLPPYNKAIISEKTESDYNSIKIGSVHSGRIINIKQYGLSVQIHENIVGLLPPSEMQMNNSTNVEYKIGDEINVSVIFIDVEKKRIGFTLYRTSKAGQIECTNPSLIGHNSEIHLN